MENQECHSYYELLGVQQTATRAEIKKAYHCLALRSHPDKNPSKKAEAETLFKKISKAYQILSNDSSRAEYDSNLASVVNRQQGSGDEEDSETETDDSDHEAVIISTDSSEEDDSLDSGSCYHGDDDDDADFAFNNRNSDSSNSDWSSSNDEDDFSSACSDGSLSDLSSESEFDEDVDIDSERFVRVAATSTNFRQHSARYGSRGQNLTAKCSRRPVGCVPSFQQRHCISTARNFQVRSDNIGAGAGVGSTDSFDRGRGRKPVGGLHTGHAYGVRVESKSSVLRNTCQHSSSLPRPCHRLCVADDGFVPVNSQNFLIRDPDRNIQQNAETGTYFDESQFTDESSSHVHYRGHGHSRPRPNQSHYRQQNNRAYIPLSSDSTAGCRVRGTVRQTPAFCDPTIPRVAQSRYFGRSVGSARGQAFSTCRSRPVAYRGCGFRLPAYRTVAGRVTKTSTYYPGEVVVTNMRHQEVLIETVHRHGRLVSKKACRTSNILPNSS